MAMDLENIMQDTIVIEARAREKKGARGRSKKWKELMKLPLVAHVLYLRTEIEHRYEYLVEQQPIGNILFKQFCQNSSQLTKCVDFVQALDDLLIVADEKFGATARKIYEDFLMQSQRQLPVSDELSEAVKTQLESGEGAPKTVFNECRQVVRDFLSGQPFVEYIESKFYWRYLQWKHLERGQISKNSFRVYRVLGKGGFGLVHACQSKASGKMYALKKLEKKRVKKRKGEKLALNEKQILERVNSKFVVTLAYAYQSKEALCMVLTLMNGGDLRFHIHNIGSPGLSPERVVFYAAEMATGLAHLHAARIAYRDMKPDNILLDDHGHVRISDLGLAVHIPEGQSVRGRVGTVGYMAPEVIDNHRYTFSPDWWGLGCVVYEMIHGECPYRRRKERVSRDTVEKRVKEDVPKFSDKFTEDAKLFCLQLLEKTHSSRLGYGPTGFDHVKAHPFFRTINWTHLEKGILEPPFKPNPRAVYAKDVLDIDAFSSIKGVEIEGSDEEFAIKFSTGAVSEPWQTEMIEMKVFDDINKLFPIDSMTMDSNAPSSSTSPLERTRRGTWFQKIFKFKRSSSSSVESPTTENHKPLPIKEENEILEDDVLVEDNPSSKPPPTIQEQPTTEQTVEQTPEN